MSTVSVLLSTLFTFSGAAPAVDGPTDWRCGSLEPALADARAEERLALLYFWADGSEFCGRLYTETLEHERARGVLDEFVCYSAKHSQDTAHLFERFKVETLPTLLFVDGSGTPQDAMTGFVPIDEFVDRGERIARGEGTLADLRKRVASAVDGSPEHLEARFLLAGKLLDLKDRDGHDAELAEVRAADPKGASEHGARALLWQIERELADAIRDPKDDVDYALQVEALDLSPLRRLAKTVKPKRVKFEIWSALANWEARARRLPAACEAIRSAAKVVPDERALDWYDRIVRWLAEAESELTSVEKKLAVDFAKTGVALAMKAEKADARPKTPAGDASGDRATCAAMDWNAVVARRYDTLAIALLMNRKVEKARHAAKRAIERDDRDEHRATLKRIDDR